MRIFQYMLPGENYGGKRRMSSKFNTDPTAKSERISRLVENLYRKMPEIEPDRAVLLTESYRETEGEPIIMRRAKAFAHILAHIPITIREEELVVGSSTLAPRGCQTFPEFSYEWLEAEFDTIEKRSADPFYISEDTKKKLREVHKYWKGKTTSELALSYMAPEAAAAIEHNIFTPGNYFYNGVGHVTVQYEKVLEIGLEGIIREAARELAACNVGDGDYARKHCFLEAVIMSCAAVIGYAGRYAALAKQEAEACTDKKRKEEVEIRNRAESLVYETEKSVKDLGDKLSEEEKTEINDAKDQLQAVLNNGTVDQIKEKTEALTEKFHIISTKLYQQAQAAGQDPSAAAGAGFDPGQQAQGTEQTGPADDNVVDADYEVVDDDK